ncbi:MAG: hypothetical protein JW917_02700 [Ignavibacteria bacterium]|nr:hypothetical protein [Ignavibacteria bacterium]
MTEQTQGRVLNITPEEIESGKTMAFVAYLIFFIPLLIEEQRKNKFVMFHTEQSLLILLIYVAGFILGTIGSFFCIGAILYLIVVFAFVLWIIGVINALSGKVKEVPLVGQFGAKFNFVK